MEKGEIPFLSIFYWYFLGMVFCGYYGHIQPKENKGNKITFTLLNKELTNNMKCVIIKE